MPRKGERMQRGFTIPELLITLAVVSLLVAASLPSFWNFLNKYQLDASAQDLAHVLRMAQRLSMESEGDSVYSVRLMSGAGGSFTLYRGSAFASRDLDYDDEHTLPDSLELSYTVPDADVTFTKVEGTTSDVGTITLTWPDSGLSYTIDINAAGRVDFQ